MAWQLYEWAKDQTVRPAARKLILLLVADHADVNTRECHPSQSYLAVESGLSERQVHSHLKALAEDDGLIDIEERKGARGTFGYNVYRLRANAADLAPYFAQERTYLTWRAKRAGERTTEVQRRPETNGSPLPTVDDATNGSTASSPTEVWRPGQRKPTSVKPKRQPKSETTKDDPAGAASLALNADALSMESDDADASSAAAKASARTNDRSAKPKKPKPPTLDQRLDAHLAALGPDTIDEMHQDLDNDRGGILTWAVKKARKTLGLDWSDDPEDDPGGPLARKAVALALMALSKPDGGGITPTVEHLLGDFDWPDERMPSAARPGAKERPVLSRVEYYRAPDGASDDDVHQTLYKQVDALDDDELAARVEWLRTYRPGIYRQCSENATAQAERGGGDWSSRDLDNLTFKYAIRHYEGRWPMFVVPSAKRGSA